MAFQKMREAENHHLTNHTDGRRIKEDFTTVVYSDIMWY